MIRAQVADLTLDEAVHIIAEKHVAGGNECAGWEQIQTFNLGGCDYFGPVPTLDAAQPDAHS